MRRAEFGHNQSDPEEIFNDLKWSDYQSANKVEFFEYPPDGPKNLAARRQLALVTAFLKAGVQPSRFEPLTRGYNFYAENFSEGTMVIYEVENLIKQIAFHKNKRSNQPGTGNSAIGQDMPAMPATLAGFGIVWPQNVSLQKIEHVPEPFRSKVVKSNYLSQGGLGIVLDSTNKKKGLFGLSDKGRLISLPFPLNDPRPIGQTSRSAEWWKNELTETYEHINSLWSYKSPVWERLVERTVSRRIWTD